MRYIFSLVLLLSACTRANPDAVGGGGGSAGNGGGSGTGGSGGGGGGAGGGGGSAGGGGSGGGLDLAMSLPHDMAHQSLPDMATLTGVACGMMSCKGSEPDCCINSQGPHCINGMTGTGCVNGPLFACDGPEDCGGQLAPDCCLELSNSGGNPKPTGSGCMFSSDSTCSEILCHSASDCSAADGYVGCCPFPQTSQYKHCSKTSC